MSTVTVFYKTILGRREQPYLRHAYVLPSPRSEHFHRRYVVVVAALYSGFNRVVHFICRRCKQHVICELFFCRNVLYSGWHQRRMTARRSGRSRQTQSQACSLHPGPRASHVCRSFRERRRMHARATKSAVPAKRTAAAARVGVQQQALPYKQKLSWHAHASHPG